MPCQSDKNMTTAKKAAEWLFAAQQQASRNRPGKNAPAYHLYGKLLESMVYRIHLSTGTSVPSELVVTSGLARQQL
ncbi:hypothetical protein LZ32DRAFT_612155 [Colletotrichum eremochloae]|nr:hypothetical protein LZ32DRAFT_612155 [Colletotrichum eremochloae]